MYVVTEKSFGLDGKVEVFLSANEMGHRFSLLSMVYSERKDSFPIRGCGYSPEWDTFWAKSNNGRIFRIDRVKPSTYDWSRKKRHRENFKNLKTEVFG